MRCSYIYCRRPLATPVEVCPVCGTSTADGSAPKPSAEGLDGLPPAIFDMHQIVPAFEGCEQVQLGVMKLFGIERVLLQSAPAQATSLWGNRQLLDLSRRHPDRFWASHFVDPRSPTALDELEQCARDRVPVVKLLPPAGYQPDDSAFDPFWSTMERLGLVVMVHTGFITARHKREEAKAGAFMSSRFSNPLFFDMPARKCPELRIILCHLGGAMWFEQGAQMVAQHEHVWGDVSGFGIFALRRLLHVDSEIPWSKVFWGNDSPPNCYTQNLRIVLRILDGASATELATGLFHDNGRRFAQAYLGLAK